MRHFTIVFVITSLILLSIAACVVIGNSANQGGPGVELVIVGDGPDVSAITQLVSDADQEEIRSAAARAIARTKKHGGDWEVSYSKNGKYRMDKTRLPSSIKDEIPLVESVLIDESGREVSQWPRMYKNIFVSNTGRNLVAAEMTWGTAFDFYDTDHPGPIKSYRRHIADGQFSADGKYFVALSAGVALFAADGELLWRRQLDGGSMVFISPDGNCVVVVNGRPARESEQPSQRTGQQESREATVKSRQLTDVTADQEQDAHKLPERQRVHPSTETMSPITAFGQDGGVLLEYDTGLYRIDEVTFSPDGRHFAVVGTNEFLVFESRSATLIERRAVGPAWDDIANVAFSPEGSLLVVAVTRYPTATDPTRPKAFRYELWDLGAWTKVEIAVDEIGTAAFSEDGEYVVCQGQPKSLFEGQRRVGLAPGGLQLLRIAPNH